MVQEITRIETARRPRTHGCASGNELRHETNCRNFMQSRSQIPHKSGAIPQRGANSAISFDKSGVPDSVLVFEWTSSWRPIGHTPDLREAPLEKWIRAAGDDGVGIRTELRVHDLAGVNQRTSHFVSGSRFVQIHIGPAYDEEIFAVPA